MEPLGHCYNGWTQDPRVARANYEARKALNEHIKQIDLRREIEERYDIDLDEWKAEEDYQIELRSLRHG